MISGNSVPRGDRLPKVLPGFIERPRSGMFLEISHNVNNKYQHTKNNYIIQAITITLVIFTTLLGDYFQPQFLCGVAIYAFVSAVVLTAFHLRGLFNKSNFPWIWVECVNSAIIVLLLFISSTLLAAILTRGCIVTGVNFITLFFSGFCDRVGNFFKVVGYVAVMIYVMDTIDKFVIARAPRAQYVWTTPNMPE